MIFDGPNKRIILTSSTTSSSEIWSEWVKWLDSDFDNNKWPQAMKQVGGDDLGSGLLIPPYIFLLNGWRVRPMEMNHLLVITGNIFVDGGGQSVVNTLGNFNVSIQYTVPVQAQGYSTTSSGGSSITADQIWSYPTRELTSSVTSSLTSEEHNKLMSLDTSNISASVDPQDIWEYSDRTLTVASGLTSEQLATLNTILTKVSNLDGISVNVNPADIWSYSDRTLTVASGLTSEQEAKIDSIKSKTDKFAFDISNRVLSYLVDKSGFSLTELERNSIAGAVQSQIINESDGALVLQAITDKIASVNPSLGELTLGAIASAVWMNTTRTLTQQVGLTPEQQTQLANIASDVWNNATRELTSAVALTPSQEAKLDAIPASVWSYTNRNLSGIIPANLVQFNGNSVQISDFLTDLSGIPEEIWSFHTRNITNPNTLTASNIWSHEGRSLTEEVRADIRKVQGIQVTGINDFKADISGLPSSIWSYINRSLTVQTGLSEEQNTALMNIPSRVWSNPTRTITNPSTLNVYDIWNYSNRSLTNTNMNLVQLNSVPVTLQDFKTDISSIPSNVWGYVNRTLTQELSLDSGTIAKIDSIKAKTDKMVFDASNRVLSYLDIKTGFALTVDEKYQIANIVEQEILNEGDSEKVIQAIVDKIAQANPTLDELTLSGIAQAVWSNNTRTLSVSSGLTPEQEAKIDAIPNSVWNNKVRTTTDSKLSAAQVWGYSNRSLNSVVDANIVKVNSSDVNIQDFRTDLSGIPTAVWNYINRSTTDFKLSASDVWGYSDRTLSSEIGLTPEQEAKIDAVKLKTDKLSFKSGTQELISFVQDKTGFSLLPSNVIEISNSIQEAISNETDGYSLITQISDKIYSENPGLSTLSVNNITEAVWNYINRSLTTEVNLTTEQISKIEEINTRIKGTIKANVTEVNSAVVSIDDFKNDISEVSTLSAEDIWSYTNRTLTQSVLTSGEHDKLMSLDTIILRKVLLNTKEIKNNQMIIYDDDGMTPLFKWNLKDKDGSSSELSVFKSEKVNV